MVTMTELTTSTNGQSLHLRRTSLLTPCRFLRPRMIYTSGVITSLTESQTLKQFQDNKLGLVCSALDVDGALLLRSLRKTMVAT